MLNPSGEPSDSKSVFKALTSKLKRGPVALLSLSSWCLVTVWWLFLAVPWVCLWFVIVVFSDHTHSLFLIYRVLSMFELCQGIFHLFR